MSGARGESYLVVDGEQRAILFTNRAIVDAERLTGKTVLQLANAYQAGTLTMTDLAQMLLVGMEHARREARTGGRAYVIADAFAVMDACGFLPVTNAVYEALGAVITFQGGKSADESPPANGIGTDS